LAGYPPPPDDDYGQPPSEDGYRLPPPPGEFNFSPPQPQPAVQPEPPVVVGTNKMAKWSLACSLLLWVCWGIGPVLGIIFGYVALNQIKETGEDGRAMAQAGIVIGVVILVFGAIVMITTN
jgi:Domain of unknown function (DUF4190)